MPNLKSTSMNILLIAVILSMSFFGSIFLVILFMLDLPTGVAGVFAILFFLVEFVFIILLLIFGVWKKRKR